MASPVCIESLLDQFVTNAYIYYTKFWYQYVHRFPNLAAQYHVKKASFTRKFTLNGKCGMLNFEEKVNRCRRFSDMPMILYCLPLTSTLPVLKL